MKKILFVHIPKAGGSSVNKIFTDFFSENLTAVHLESNEIWSNRVDRIALVERCKYISGHLVLEDFREKLDLDEFFTFTFLRNPVFHVISHLAWIRKLAEPNQINKFNAHPAYIQALALKMKAVDFTNGPSTREFVSKLEPAERGLLDNPQVRYLRIGNRGNIVTESDVQSALQSLRSINWFGRVETMADDLLALIETDEFNIDLFNVKENISDNTYSMSIDNPEFLDAVNDLIKFDVDLYALAGKLNRKNEKIELKREVRLKVDKANRNILHGWALAVGYDFSVSVDLYVDEIYVDTVRATDSRPDLKLKFNKDCAFKFDLDNHIEIRTSSRYKIINSSNGKILAEGVFDA